MRNTVVLVSKLPKCDFCSAKATYDGKTRMGPWAALMCEYHHKLHGIGLGVGNGQRLMEDESQQTFGKSQGATLIFGKQYRYFPRYPVSNEDIGTIVKTGLVLIAFFVGLYYLASGVSLFGAADYFKDPVQAFQNQTAGVLQIGVGATILLVTIGGVAAVAALLRFIARVSDR